MLFCIKLWQVMSPGWTIMNQRTRDNQNTGVSSKKVLCCYISTPAPLRLHIQLIHKRLYGLKYWSIQPRLGTSRLYFLAHWKNICITNSTKKRAANNQLCWIDGSVLLYSYLYIFVTFVWMINYFSHLLVACSVIQPCCHKLWHIVPTGLCFVMRYRKCGDEIQKMWRWDTENVERKSKKESKFTNDHINSLDIKDCTTILRLGIGHRMHWRKQHINMVLLLWQWVAWWWRSWWWGKFSTGSNLRLKMCLRIKWFAVHDAKEKDTLYTVSGLSL